ncbi:GNAT family N-acetyltransferase [uncultured Ferrimonas sp.]|uniref:GNAT family N-acetyltransferase n=1 Tax=uncultured Ferrimonas sp. TaxID=432640 RepID=UPI002623D0D1|nr:GNAT family N-acetyltransferase [uncultured Ferrimonas sp.]
MLRAEFVDSIATICPKQWQPLFDNGYPFTQLPFLLALEQQGGVGGDSGWLAQHWLLWRNNQLIAAAPNYIKLHSYGEYLFDWAWADAYQQHQLNYYPKLLSAIPYTPATGPRLGIAAGEDSTEIIAAYSHSVRQRGQQLHASNAQLLFCDQPLQQQLQQQGWLSRRDIQFHWHNRSYANFEQFLTQLSARKRKNINKERALVAQAAVQIRTLGGDEIDNAMWQRFYHCYHTTYLKRSARPGYLSLDFFLQLGRTMPDNVVMIAAFSQQELVAAALYFQDDSSLYGRYWGSLIEQPGLHFELCYYRGIEYCIGKGLQRFDPGAQGEHKLARGFEPHWVYGSSLLFDSPFAAAIARFCQQEDQLLRQRMQELQQRSPYKRLD